MTQYPRYPLGMYNQPYAGGSYASPAQPPQHPAPLPDLAFVPVWPSTPAPLAPAHAARPRASLPLHHRASEPNLAGAMSSLDIRNKPLPPVPPAGAMPAMAMAVASGPLPVPPARAAVPPPLPERPPPPPYSALPTTNTITQAIHGVPAPPPIPPRPTEKATFNPPPAAFGDFPPVPAPPFRLAAAAATSSSSSASSSTSTYATGSTAPSSSQSAPTPPPAGPCNPKPGPLKQAKLHFNPRMSQQKSASSQNLSTQAKPRASSTPKGKGKKPAVIDLTGSDNDSYSPSDSDSGGGRLAPPQTRHQRAHSQPPSSAAPHTPAPKGKKAGPRLSKPSAPDAARCSGFTRSGQPCKRTVKATAPFLAGLESDEEGEERTGRYCKDHAGLVCAVDGFYWSDRRGRSGVWVEFKDYIPPDLGQQTQTLLRMTMESALTAKELPGFLYAYELRAKGGRDTAYFKVGRTDNVPRRIGQWTQQCQSHTPTLRDIFPLSGAALKRRPSGPGSLLPGAVKGGVEARRMVPAVKRWERLVHLELSDRSASQRGSDYDAVRQPCADCGTIHKEIFPLADDGVSTYEEVVVEVIERWEKFVRKICASA
ncbi:hypothetical protein Q8F55_004420 [Vanrija albida]|uniref:Bacteriophage T5 Orf172 DNA-binding domain-containing protein n=1 Tax=Vanrija albida TaxID=181172 RepID=A0ABR3Q6N6_9TREE